MFKFHQGSSPEILSETFVFNTSLYNLRRNDTSERHQMHSVFRGTGSLSSLSPKICYLIPEKLKQLERFDCFKLKRKNYIPCKCPFSLCKTYIQQEGIL